MAEAEAASQGGVGGGDPDLFRILFRVKKSSVKKKRYHKSNRYWVKHGKTRNDSSTLPGALLIRIHHPTNAKMNPEPMVDEDFGVRIPG